MNIKAIISWILARLKEPSTWRGILTVIAAMGVAITPANATIILAAGVGLAGFINIVISDPNKDFKAEIDSAINDVIIPVVEATIKAKAIRK